MARHNHRKPGGVPASEILAKLTESPSEDETPTAPIQAVQDDLEPLTRPLPRVRIAASLAVGLAATALIPTLAEMPHDQDPTVTDQSPLQRPAATPEEVGVQLASLAAAHARQAAEEDAAQAVQDAADAAELERRRVADEEARKEAARAAQEAAEQAAQAEASAAAAESSSGASSTVRGGVIVPSGRVTSGFGARWGTTHYGVDIAAPLGTDIYSPVSGTVVKAGAASGFGNAIYIQDAAGDVWLFGHMRRMNVSTGDRVNVGDLIAWVGNEGQSTGPHVHIERHLGGINGQKVDPAPALGL